MKYNIFLVFVFVSILIFPYATSAQSEQTWGGLHLVTLGAETCTCSGNSNWILDYKTQSLLMLYYQAGQSKLFTNYNTYATYQLGTYSSGSQSCSILIYSECVDIPNMGTYGMSPGTGTSLTKNREKSTVALFQPYESTRPINDSYFASLRNTSRGLLKAMSI